MAQRYFVKRGETVKGPFSLKKLQQLEAAKKLTANDLIGANESGPWEPIAAVYKSIHAGESLSLTVSDSESAEQASAKPSDFGKNLPLLKDGELVKKRLTGKTVLRGTCPNCGTGLTLTQPEILKSKDACPDCATWFAVAPAELKKVQALNAVAEESKEQNKRYRPAAAARERRDAEQQRELDEYEAKLRRRDRIAAGKLDAENEPRDYIGCLWVMGIAGALYVGWKFDAWALIAELGIRGLFVWFFAMAILTVLTSLFKK